MELTTLRATLRGELIGRGHSRYDEARRIWNGALDRHPLAVARCTSVHDVVAGLRFAREHDLPLAVRGGGHSLAGLSTCDDGLVLDLGPLQAVEVDGATRRASAGAGNTWATYDTATQAHGLASPGGEISSTGIAGLTLGGGIGWLSRQHGLACDNLVGAQLVTVEGDVIEAAEHPDLLWALKGGGGNFGVVTRFDYTVHPVGPIIPVALAMHRPERFVDALLALQELVAGAPAALGLNVAMITAPPAPTSPPRLHGQPVAVVVASWTGDPAEAEGHLAPVLGCGTPEVADLTTMPYVALQSMVDESVPHGLGSYLKSEFLRPLERGAVEQLVEGWVSMSTPMGQVLLRLLGGAISRVPEGATAFTHRNGTWMLTVAALWPDPSADASTHMRWSRGLWEALRPSSAGTYVNHLAPDDADRRRDAWDDRTWARLTEVKRSWDPDNVLRLNQNIPPRITVPNLGRPPVAVRREAAWFKPSPGPGVPRPILNVDPAAASDVVE